MTESTQGTESAYTPKNTVKDLNNEARNFFLQLVDDAELYKSYLTTIAKFPSYSAMNAVHIHKKAPGAQEVKDSSAWQKEKHFIKKGEEGIPVTQPVFDEKTGKTFFKVKYLFTDAQVNGRVEAAKAYDEKALEEAFSLVEVPAPTSGEGRFIVGQHFGIGGYLKDGTTPPLELVSVDKVEEACANVKEYVDTIRRDAKTFIRAVEETYKTLVSEATKEQNHSLYQSFKRAQFIEALPSRATATAVADNARESAQGAQKTSGQKPEKPADLDEKLSKAEEAAKSEKADAPAKKDEIAK